MSAPLRQRRRLDLTAATIRGAAVQAGLTYWVPSVRTPTGKSTSANQAIITGKRVRAD